MGGIEVDPISTGFKIEKDELIQHLDTLIELWSEPRDDFWEG